MPDERARRRAVRAERARAGASTSARPPSCRTPGRAARSVVVHGWVYGLHNGLLEDLHDHRRRAETTWPAPTTRALARGAAPATTSAGGRADCRQRRCSRTELTDQPRLRHRAGDARRLQPPLPAVPRDQRRRPSSASRRPTGTASSARSASASSSTTSASTKRPSGCRREFDIGNAVDGHLAAGQAALHRPADQPPPARAGRDLLQLGHDQDPAPQLLPQRLHLRAAGGLHRVHRERRAGLAADLPRLLPDARRRCARRCCASSPTSSCEREFEDLGRDIDHVLDAVRAAARRHPRLRTNFQIQVLSSLFFRNKGAYIVGKIINGFTRRRSRCRSCTTAAAS